MTDAVSMLINLITLVESNAAGCKLEVSRTYYDIEDFTPKKRVSVDGSLVCVVELADLMKASKDWPVLRHEVLEKYMPARGESLTIPTFEIHETHDEE